MACGTSSSGRVRSELRSWSFRTGSWPFRTPGASTLAPRSSNVTDFSSCASQRLPVEGAALRRLLARSYREPAIARAVNGIDGWFHPRERRRRPRRRVYVSIGSRLPHLLNLLVRLGHCGQPSNDEMVVVESDATQYLNHFRRMAVVLVADGPVRGIDLRETAVAVAVEFELVVAAQIRD